MLAACQLKIVETGHERSRRSANNSGSTASEIVKKLAAFSIATCHPKGTVLFLEGQPSRGVFILSSGRVKLFTSSADGKPFILRFAEPGEILGLAGTVSGRPYEASAEATQPTQTSLVRREHLVDIIRRNSRFAEHVAMHLGESYCSAIAGVRSLVFSRSATQKLAVFLLDWCESNRPEDAASATCTLTHEHIAQAVGISRETVTRLLSGFKKKGLIQWRGSNLVLRDRTALESSAGR